MPANVNKDGWKCRYKNLQELPALTDGIPFFVPADIAENEDALAALREFVQGGRLSARVVNTVKKVRDSFDQMDGVRTPLQVVNLLPYPASHEKHMLYKYRHEAEKELTNGM